MSLLSRIRPATVTLLAAVGLVACGPSAPGGTDAGEVPTANGEHGEAGAGLNDALTEADSATAPPRDRKDPDVATPPPSVGGDLGSTASPTPRPSWLGTRVLPLREDGFGEVQPTPPELQDRRLPPPEDGHRLPAPPDDGSFAAQVEQVPDHVAARSTWSPQCPVALTDLRYVTLTHWGFDDQAHTGELLVHGDVADELVGVFGVLHEARFPIEEMRVVTLDELDAPPMGDGNNTTAFVCRPSVESASWSEHAFGLAVDVNPFHNPYVRGDLVLPELASAYVDRDWHRPGMIHPGDEVTEAFAGIGWGWGGDWRSTKDWMHFSRSGR